MAVKLADAVAYLKTNDDDLRAGLADGERQVNAWGSAISGMLMGAGMAAFNALASAARGAVGYVGESLTAASDLSETISKVETLFGESAGGILRWAETSATAMGLPEQAALDAVGTIGNLFMQLGAGSDQAASVGQGMVQLAADLASFHNVAGGSAKVLDAMTAAFRGEYDALQRYIPTINAAAVEQQALAMTGKESASELTNLEKAMAVQAIMARDAGAAIGDFARTSDGAANQQRILEANMANLQATLGAGLLPLWGALISALNQLVEAVMPPVTAFIEQQFVPALERAGQWIGGVGDIVSGLISIITRSGEPLGDWSLWWEHIADVFGEDVADAVTRLGERIYDFVHGISERFSGEGRRGIEGFVGTFDYLRGWIEQNMPRIRQIVESVLGAISTFWANHGDAIMTVVTNTFGVVLRIIDTTLKTVLDLVTVVLQVLTGDWEGAGQTLVGIVQRIWDTVVEVFRTQIDSLVTLFTDFDWAELGRAIVQGMIDGIVAMSSALWEAARRISQDLWDRMTGWWSVGSPSRKAERGLGVPIAQGIGAGIQTGLDDMRRQMAAGMGGLLGGLSAAVQPQAAAAGAGMGALPPITVYVSGADATYEAGRAVGRGVLDELRQRGGA